MAIRIHPQETQSQDQCWVLFVVASTRPIADWWSPAFRDACSNRAREKNRPCLSSFYDAHLWMTLTYRWELSPKGSLDVHRIVLNPGKNEFDTATPRLMKEIVPASLVHFVTKSRFLGTCQSHTNSTMLSMLGVDLGAYTCCSRAVKQLGQLFAAMKQCCLYSGRA